MAKKAKATEAAYQVLTAKGPNAAGDLECKVKEALADGWQLAGGVASDGRVLVQAMTK